jgi:hypothetical protein
MNILLHLIKYLMMVNKKRKKRNVIPLREDPNKTKLVKKESGWYLRAPRGSIKKAVLNNVLEKNSKAWEITNPATKRITAQLEPYTRCFRGNYLHQRLNGFITKTYNEKGGIDFLNLKGFEIHNDYPLNGLLLSSFTIQQHDDLIEILVPVKKESVKRNNTLVTDFYFEGILLYGNALKENGLKTAYVLSEPYGFDNTVQGTCKLNLRLPAKKQPWMLLLKVSCLEGNEMAAHQKHYAMKVVAVGG